jgi:hypothetical protein
MERALQAKRLKYGFIGSDTTLRTCEHCGALLHEMGRLEESEILLREALEGRKGNRRGGGENNDMEDDAATLNCISLLISVLVAQPTVARFQEKEIIMLLRRELAGRERLQGTIHQDTLDVVTKLGKYLHTVTWREEKEKTAAEIEVVELLMRAVQGYERILGSTHTRTLDAHLRLATLRMEMAKEMSTEMAMEMMAGQGTRASSTTTTVLTTVLEEGAKEKSTEQQQQHMNEAEKHARLCVQGHVENRDVRRMHGTIPTLVHVLRSLKKNEEADTVLHSCLSQMYGQYHAKTIAAARDLANQTWQMNVKHNGNGAVELWQDVVDGNTMNLGESHPATLLSMKEFSNCILSQRRLNTNDQLFRASSMLKKEIQIRVKSCGGPKHSETIHAVHRLGELFWRRLDMFDQALVCLKRVFDARMLVNGPFHVLTLQAASNVSDLCVEMKKYELAEEYGRVALEGYETLFDGADGVDGADGADGADGVGVIEMEGAALKVINILMLRNDEEEAARVAKWYNVQHFRENEYM